MSNNKRHTERVESLAERRETKDRVQPVLDLLEHVFGQLQTNNGRRAYLSAVKRLAHELTSRIPPGNKPPTDGEIT